MNMDKVTDQMVEEAAILSELSLTEEEKALAKQDMDEMLAFFRTMQGIDLSEENADRCRVTADPLLRKDEILSVDGRDAALSGAPQRSGDFFVVPRTIDRE